MAQGASRDLNPSLPQKVVDRAYQRDAASAAGEYGGSFRADLKGVFFQEAIDNAVVPGRLELPFLSSVSYFAFVDAAVGSGQNSMSVSIAHREEDGWPC